MISSIFDASRSEIRKSSIVRKLCLVPAGGRAGLILKLSARRAGTFLVSPAVRSSPVVASDKRNDPCAVELGKAVRLSSFFCLISADPELDPCEKSTSL
jgi:hypothetical protein